MRRFEHWGIFSPLVMLAKTLVVLYPCLAPGMWLSLWLRLCLAPGLRLSLWLSLCLCLCLALGLCPELHAQTAGIKEASASEDPFPLGPPLEANVPEAAAPFKLFGTIQHSDTLPELPPHLRVGAKLDITRLKVLTPNNQWFRIPDWFAGTWESNKQTTYYERELDTGAESFPNKSHFALGSGTAGFQKDRKGDIWEYTYSDYIAVIKLKGGFDIQLTRIREPIEVSENRVVMLFRGHSVLLESATGTVVQSGQSEQIQTFTPAGHGLVQIDASIKSFDETGKATCLSKVIVLKRRISEFSSWNRLNGKDLHKLFNEYLQAHGLSELCTK